ncbi:unnamed protein product [Alopecurus aequalis]
MEPSTSPVAEAQVQRAKRRLTQEQIEKAMALERRPFQPPGLDLFARMGARGAEALEIFAEAAKEVEAIQDIQMKYKERVLRQFAEKGYVELTDNEDEDDGLDKEWERDMVFD